MFETSRRSSLKKAHTAAVKWLFLIASIVSGLMTLLFVWLIIFYYWNYRPPSLRGLALLAPIAMWTLLTNRAFLRFRAGK